MNIYNYQTCLFYLLLTIVSISISIPIMCSPIPQASKIHEDQNAKIADMRQAQLEQEKRDKEVDKNTQKILKKIEKRGEKTPSPNLIKEK